MREARYMKLKQEVGGILADLRNQVISLQENLKKVEEETPKDAPPSNLFEGAMMASLMSQSEPDWFSKFLHSLSASMGCQHLMLCTLLCMRRAFKQLLLDSPELQSVLFTAIKQYDPVLSEIDSVIWYKSLMYSLIKSKEDKPRIIYPQLKSAGYTFSEQSRLEESMAQNPQIASVLGSAGQNDEWSTEIHDANIILDLVISEKVVASLVKVKAVETLACICRAVPHRALVQKLGGVQVLLEGASKAPSLEHKEQIQVALARMCMTTGPRLWKYPQIIELSNACFDLIASANYELYLFEAGIGLTNLLACSDEVLNSIGAKPESVEKFFELISNSQDDRVQLVGAELFCNLCRSQAVAQQIRDGAHKDQLKLLPFLVQKGNDAIQSAASGALAILTSNEELVPFLTDFVSDPSWLVEKVNQLDMSEEVELRMASIMSNLIQFSDNNQLKERLTLQMKAIHHRAESRNNDSPALKRLLSLVESYS